MGPRKQRVGAICLFTLVCVSLLVMAPVFAGDLDLVIEEDFENGIPPGLSLVGTSAIVDDGSSENNVLMLTTNGGNQGGWAWFEQEFDLSDQRVEIEFDLFIGMGNTPSPADGAAVIFQFDGDLGATGNRGGDLGYGNLGGGYDYIAVGFDIWDNGAADPETPCDGRPGPNSTSRTRVHRRSASPHSDPGLAQGDLPDLISSAAIYGSPDPALNNGDESWDADDLVHVKIVFDAGFMQISIRGGVDCVDAVSPFEEQAVVDVLTGALPDALSNIGFSAATGGANAFQWIDNVIVREGESLVEIVHEEPRTAGAINCAGEEVDTSDEVGSLFEADRPVGAEVSREGDLETGITLTTSSFGRVGLGADFVDSNLRRIDVSNIDGAGDETARIFVNGAWSTIGVAYESRVVPGRYSTTLYWSESYTGAVDSLGRGTRLYDVYLGDERVLCNWSAAAAAGSETSSGSPLPSCTAVTDVAVARTFEFDVDDSDDGTGVLSVLIDDLGNGNPPENAALNALSFRRVGDVSGENASGDLECIGMEPGAEPPGSFVDEDFDDQVELECPEGWVCNTNSFMPQVIAGRLRITEDVTGSSATSAIYEETVNVLDFTFTADFDVYMGNPDGGGDPGIGGAEAADGAAFFVMQGNDTSALGGGGGDLGVPGNAYGFAVEFDTWNNGAAGNDPSGFNDVSQQYTHIGINNMGSLSTLNHVQFDPDLRPVAYGGTGWPNFFDPDGVHVTVEYDAGLVTVLLEGVTAEGEEFGPEVVCEANVVPILEAEAVVGFSGGTGGRTQDTEFDNVEILAAEGEPSRNDPVAQALEDALESWNDGQGRLFINCGGPMLFCSSTESPAPGATGEETTGENVVWLADLAGGAGLDPVSNDFFTVTSIPNHDFSDTGLQVANTNMGNWDARGTEPGVDDNDRIFHSERWSDHQYDIPAENGAYEVTLYFANSHSGTSGTARRFFYVHVDEVTREGFEHCPEHTLRGFARANPLFGEDRLFDPVGAAENLYSPDPCNFAPCENNGVSVSDDPDNDGILAGEECGNAAASALRYTVEVADEIIQIALTEPVVDAGDPAAPDMSPKISGISIRRVSGPPPSGFVRGDPSSNGVVGLTDGILILNFLFLGGAAPSCMDSGDVDDDGSLAISDAVGIFSYLFLGGAPPRAPGPLSTVYTADECGPDPTDDALDCATPGPVCAR